MYAIVPLKRDKSKDEPKVKKEKPRVPEDAREIGDWKANRATAMDFAILTGDFNPVHWIPPYARAAGFKNTILHGFATLGLTIETMNHNVWAGDPSRPAVIDVKFTKPLVLPNQVRVFTEGDGFAVGDAAGGPAYLTGTFEMRDSK
jgi:acyl dehydratase